MAADVAELQATVKDLRNEQSVLKARVAQLEAASAKGSAMASFASNASSRDIRAELIARADELHAADEVDALFELLENADSRDDELAWRVARAYHDKAMDSAEAAADLALKEKLLREGLAIAELSKDKTGGGSALKWYAILLGRLGDFLPTKEKVANSFKVKEALDGAAQQLTEDASIQTALGQWCYKVASISWVERTVASALFGEPPDCSYDDALAFAVRSHELRPTKKAALLAGQCHGKLQAREAATEWLNRCLEMESTGESDKDLDRQAKNALAKI